MIRRFNKACWSLAVVLIVVVAIVASLIRLVFPVISDYRQDIEQWVYEAVEYPVSIGAMNTRWAGFSPVLYLSDVQLLTKDSNQNLLSFDSVYVGLDLWNSIKKGRVVPGKVTLSGLNLVLAKEEDGRISVAGLPIGHNKKNTSFRTIFHKWFFSHGALSIEQANISWENKQQKHKPVMFTQLNLIMASSERRHQLTVNGKMPGKLGEDFTFLLDAHGDITDIEVWDMNAYITIGKINLDHEILSDFLPERDIVSGVAGMQAWLDWRNGHLTHASVDIEVSDFLVKSRLQHSFALDKAKGRLEWQANEKGWLLSSHSLLLNIADEAPLPLDFVVQASNDEETFEIGVAHFPVNLFSMLAVFSDNVQKQLKQYIAAANPQGTLNESYIRFSVGPKASPFKLSAKVVDFALQPVKKAPGFSGLDFGVNIDDDVLQLNVLASDAVFNAPELFRSPIKVDNIEGALHIFRDEERDLIINVPQLDIVNEDIHSRSRMELVFPGEGAAPIVNLNTTFREGNGGNAARYYPAGVLSPPLLDWLDNAIVSAEVPSGSLTLKGSLSRFPFVNGGGIFDLRFIIEKGVLEFSPNWPRLDDITAEVKFIGRSMSIDAVSARTLDSSLRNVNVEVEDFFAKDRAVRVVGEAQGLGSDGIRYVLESPLNETLGDFFSLIKIDKKVDVFLDMRVPINKLGQHTRIDGGVEFEGNTFVYGDDSVDVSRLHGLIGFSEDGIVAHALTAQVMGQPATIDIESQIDPISQKTIINIEAAGTTRLKVLRQRLGFDNINFVQGETDWTGHLRLIPFVDVADGVTAELNIYSMLEGVNIDLPLPLGKKTDTQAELNVALLFPGDASRSVVIYYGDILTSKLQLRSLPSNNDEGLELVEGWVNLGGGEPPSIQSKGLSIYGQLPVLDFEKWQSVFSETLDAQSENGSGVTEINMTFSEVLIFGQRLTAMDVQAQPQEKGWNVLFEGQNAAGRAFIPAINTESIVLDLNYYYLYSQEDDRTASVSDPRNGRPFHFVSQAFFYDNLSLGKMAFNVVTTPSGLKMEQFSLLSEKTRIMGEGEWIVRGGRAHSSFDLSVESSDAGATLEMFGFSGTMEKGQTTNRFQMHWNGEPGDFKLANMNGKINLAVKKGRLLEVEPGAGRVFGLLSLYALPRRLRLDFSDFFGKGFSFDTLHGSFSVEKGKAYTNDFIMRGPSANVFADGVVDFALKEYDQRITVIPHVTAPLPLAIGLVISPVAGLAAWIAESVIRKPLSRFTKVSYKVEGPWAEPNVEKIRLAK